MAGRYGEGGEGRGGAAQPRGTQTPSPPAGAVQARGTQTPSAPASGGGAAGVTPDVIREFLLSSRLIADASLAAGVASRMQALEYSAQAPILRAGAAGDWLGILYRGKASVLSVNAATGAQAVLEQLRPGDLLGEVAPLLGSAHPQMVQADEPCVVLRMGADVFQALLGRDLGFCQALARRLAMRVVRLGMTALRGGGADAGGRATAAPAEAAAPRPGGIIPFAEVSEFDPSAKLAALIPEKMVREQRLLPLRQEGTRLTIGMVNPRNALALSELRRVFSNFEIDVVAIGLDDYTDWLTRLKIATAPATPDGARGDKALKPESLAFDVMDSERDADKALRIIGDEVIRAVNRIVCAALERDASDVHIEADPAGVKVRFRVHGMLRDWEEYVPIAFAKGIVARLKVLSGLDITEKRLPQDGRIALTVGRREVDMRVSTMPASRGEKVVLRIFEAAGMMRPLEKTFHEPTVLGAVRDALGRKTGAILVAGGTGSGKSTTLYSMINERRKVSPDQNMLMVEDPIEYRLQGATQVQVNHAVGLGFSQVLRAMLRQDPDVIALGETRDPETAHIALEAAMTGHLVLTSIHAGDAMSALQRLETLNCPRELIAQSVTLILVQRLVRRLCPSCTRMEPPSPVLLDSLVGRKLVEAGARINLPRAVGCAECSQVGYTGRVAVIESLRINDEVRDAIMTHQPLTEIQKIATTTNAFFPFHRYGSHLMARSLISAADALMAVAG
ncbi:MAG: Flp pilus assembly complex ATPase component TadA [Deltaproteobacteria bacterium]|nr:Flp pilus assembly complex ATPase component TadA [Deltaproteobacteria bacterium]